MKTPKPAPQAKVLWTPLPKQRLALACPIDNILFGGAVGGGKTDFLLAAFVKHASEFKEAARGLIVRRTLPELRDIERRAKKLYPRLGAVLKVSSRTWTFPGGAELIFGYLENDEDATRYLGQEFTFVGVDEAGEFKSPDPIDFLMSRMRSPVEGVRKQLILTANPGGKGHKWLVDRYIKVAPPGKPYRDPETGLWRVYIPSRLTDNPYLMQDKSYVARIRSSGPRWLVRARLLGDWSVVVDGKVFKREHFKRYMHLPEKFDFMFQSWDTAFKATEQADRSVGITFGVKYGVGLYVVDVCAERLAFPDLKRRAKDLATQYKCQTVLIEDKASGQSLIQELQRDTPLAILPVKPDGDKLARAWAASPFIEAGRVYLPETAPWLEDFLLEVCGFPELAHDDCVDALTQGVRWAAASYTFTSTGHQFEAVKKEDDKPKTLSEKFNDPDDEVESESSSIWG